MKLVFLLIIVVGVELTGHYLRTVLHKPNAWLYNISMPIEFLVYATIFKSTYSTNIFQFTTKWFLILFPIIVLLNIAFFQGFAHFNSYTSSIGSFFMILFSCFWFYNTMVTKEKIQIIKSPMFWFSVGILFFYSGDILYTLFSNLIQSGKLKYWSLFRDKLIILLYCCFIMVFLCKRWEMKQS